MEKRGQGCPPFIHMNHESIDNLWRFGWGYLQLYRGRFVTPMRQRIAMPAIDSYRVCEQEVELNFKRYLHRGETISFIAMELFDPQEQFVIDSEFPVSGVYDGRRLNNLKLTIKRKDTNDGETRISATGSCLRP